MTNEPKRTYDLAAIKRGWSEMTEADKAAQRESFVRGQIGFGSDRDEANYRVAQDAAFYAGESAKAAAPEPCPPDDAWQRAQGPKPKVAVLVFTSIDNAEERLCAAIGVFANHYPYAIARWRKGQWRDHRDGRTYRVLAWQHILPPKGPL